MIATNQAEATIRQPPVDFPAASSYCGMHAP
jgi:hypothetical protein